MMSKYVFDSENIAEQPTGTAFPVGAQIGNVHITNVDYVSGTSQRGNDWEALKVTYSLNGANITDSMFAINPATVRARPFIPNDTKEDAIKARQGVYNAQIMQIAECLGCFTDVKTCRSLPEIAQVLNSNCEHSQSVWLKTTRDKNGYVTVCRNPNSARAFVEAMIDGRPCGLMYTAKEQSTLDDINLTNTNGVSTETTSSINYTDDNLPY